MPSSPRLARHAVAVVDDDAAALQAMQFLLEIEGYGVQAYSGGRNFLDACLQGVDCLVIDQNMPTLSGIEVAEQLRQSGVTLPIIIITATPSAELARRARAAGVIRVIERPIFGNALSETISHCLASRRACD